MYNRFSTMTEVRNAVWPSYETPEYDAAHFLQGIAGTLELFHRSTLAFQQLAGEATGHPVAVFQRIDQAGYALPIDERILSDTDTLMVIGSITSCPSRKPHPMRSARSVSGCDGRARACCWHLTTTSGSPMISPSDRSSTNITATRSCHANSGSVGIHAP